MHVDAAPRPNDAVNVVSSSYLGVCCPQAGDKQTALDA